MSRRGYHRPGGTKYNNRPRDKDAPPRIRTKDVEIFSNISFAQMMLSSNVLLGLNKCGYTEPSPIQLRAIPLGRSSFDLLIQAKSGTGKTLVFGTIILEAFQADIKAPQSLVLAPTREIAVQIEDVLKAIGCATSGFKVASFIGGLEITDDRKKLHGCNAIVGTPGRILHLFKSKFVLPDNVRIFVLDEADKLMSASFQSDIISIRSFLHKDLQTLAVSATFDNGLDRELAKMMRNPIGVTPAKEPPVLVGVQQYAFIIPAEDGKPPLVENSVKEMNEKIKAVETIFSAYSYKQCLIFSNSQSRAESFSNYLKQNDWPVEVMSGAQEQRVRLEMFKKFKNFECRILVATDLMARGIDSENADLIINLDVPNDHVTYLHRIGRCGRFGALGIAVTLLSGPEIQQKFAELLGAIGGAKMFVRRFPRMPVDNLLEYMPLDVREKVYGIEKPGEGRVKMPKMIQLKKVQNEDDASVDDLENRSPNIEPIGQIASVLSVDEDFSVDSPDNLSLFVNTSYLETASNIECLVEFAEHPVKDDEMVKSTKLLEKASKWVIDSPKTGVILDIPIYDQPLFEADLFQNYTEMIKASETSLQRIEAIFNSEITRAVNPIETILMDFKFNEPPSLPSPNLEFMSFEDSPMDKMNSNNHSPQPTIEELTKQYLLKKTEAAESTEDLINDNAVDRIDSAPQSTIVELDKKPEEDSSIQEEQSILRSPNNELLSINDNIMDIANALCDSAQPTIEELMKKFLGKKPDEDLNVSAQEALTAAMTLTPDEEKALQLLSKHSSSESLPVTATNDPDSDLIEDLTARLTSIKSMDNIINIDEKVEYAYSLSYSDDEYSRKPLNVTPDDLGTPVEVGVMDQLVTIHETDVSESKACAEPPYAKGIRRVMQEFLDGLIRVYFAAADDEEAVEVSYTPDTSDILPMNDKSEIKPKNDGPEIVASPDVPLNMESDDEPINTKSDTDPSHDQCDPPVERSENELTTIDSNPPNDKESHNDSTSNYSSCDVFISGSQSCSGAHRNTDQTFLDAIARIGLTPPMQVTALDDLTSLTPSFEQYDQSKYLIREGELNSISDGELNSNINGTSTDEQSLLDEGDTANSTYFDKNSEASFTSVETETNDNNAIGEWLPINRAEAASSLNDISQTDDDIPLTTEQMQKMWKNIYKNQVSCIRSYIAYVEKFPKISEETDDNIGKCQEPKKIHENESETKNQEDQQSNEVDKQSKNSDEKRKRKEQENDGTSNEPENIQNTGEQAMNGHQKCDDLASGSMKKDAEVKIDVRTDVKQQPQPAGSIKSDAAATQPEKGNSHRNKNKKKTQHKNKKGRKSSWN